MSTELSKALRLPYTDSQSVLANTKALFKDILKDASFGEHQVTPEAPLLDYPASRRALYKIWWSRFDNTTYDTDESGGYRSIVNDYLGTAAIGNLAPLFNPVERAVRAYEYVFDGSFGEDIRIDDRVNDEPVNKKILEPIKNIWKWSNLNGWKNEMLIKTAALGSCGLRIVYRNDNNGKRIFLVPEHPSLITYIERDERENITQIVLEYERVEGDYFDNDNPRTTHRYMEYMSRDKFWQTRDGAWWNFIKQQVVETKEEATIPNRLGIVPYVLVTQTKIGSDFGVPCFYGREHQLDHLNALAAHINQQIRRHVTATWLIEGGGPVPEKVLMGDQNIWYIHKDSTVGSQVSVKDLVSNLNLGEAISQQDKLQEELSNSMPEMKATDGQFLSHQSGGTVAQLRLPAEQRILGARTNIEAAIVKAQQIALSMGILYSMWDLGKGQGSRQVADATYAGGLLDHKFTRRAALPLTVDDKLTVAKSEQAIAAANAPTPVGVKGGDNTNIPAPQKSVSSTSGN